MNIPSWLSGLLSSNSQSSQTPSSTAPQPTNPPATPQTGNVVNATELRVDGLEERLDRAESALEKSHNEQRNIIIGVIVAAVLIVATVAIEVILFNSDFRTSLDDVQDQNHEDYKTIQQEINRTRDELHQEIIQALTKPAQ